MVRAPLSRKPRAARQPKGKSLSGLTSLALRQTERAALGTLKSRLVKPRTELVYRRSCEWFFALCASMEIFYDMPIVEFDDLVGEAIEFAWESGEGRNVVGNLLSGLEHFVPALKGRLRYSWRLWRVWGDSEVPCRAPPLSARATMAICYYLWQWGFPRTALVTMLAFATFLRTMEFVGMRKVQLSFSTKQQVVHIQLPHTKGASRRGGTEGVTLDDPTLVLSLRRALADALPGDCCMEANCRQYRILFNAACAAVGLSDSFKPYSLRRGGASSHFRRFASWSNTMDVGRWADIRTAKTYINTALLDLTAMSCFETDVILRASESFLAILARYADSTTWKQK